MNTRAELFSPHSVTLAQAHKRLNQILNLLLISLVIISSLSPAGAIPAQAGAAPTLLLPANETETTVVNYPPIGIPSFSWSSVSGATRYRIQLSQDIGFATIVLDITSEQTTYTPTTANPFTDGLWYWRVRVDAPTPSDYTPSWSFTKTWASTTNFPVLTEPANGQTLEFYDDPVFSWQPAAGSASYRFEMAISPDGFASSPIPDQVTLATTYQPAIKLANGTYYWRVVPIDPGNRDGTPSEVRSFNLSYNQVPVQLEPANNTFPTFTPSFRWTAVRGAQFYRLQYSTDPFFSSGVQEKDTRNTTFTPIDNLPNDVNYYWRVRTHSGYSISDWSPTWTFKKQWYIQPVLLTPVNNYQYVRFPIFSWTPVPGANYYKIEMDTDPDFVGALVGYSSNPFYTPSSYTGDNHVRYWRVTPYDRNSNSGKVSDVSSFVSSYDFMSVHQIYPLYYYPPNSYPPPFNTVAMNPYEDRTVPLPIFSWHRLFNPAPFYGIYAGAYRVQVSADPLFLTWDWSIDTENLVAAPTASNNFTPTPGVDYFWRVRPLSSIGGTMLGQWSQIWKTRIDLSLGLPTTAGDQPPHLLRPASAAEYSEVTPLLEWTPVDGADSYEVQISSESTFADGYTVDTATVSYPAYAAQYALAQRNLNRLNYGSYYWKVRALNSGTPLSGGWSETRRFQVASQSQWQRSRPLGSPDNQLQIGSDPTGDVTAQYDLTYLYAAQDMDNWYFGFNSTAGTSTSAGDMVYGIYLDLDHVNGSGATTDPRGYSITTLPDHRPEYAIYVFQTGREYSTDSVAIYKWEQTQWGTPQLLTDIGGDVFPVDLKGISLVSSSYGWAVGQYGRILHYNGSGWSSYPSLSSDTLNSVSMVSSTDGWAVGGYDYQFPYRSVLLRWNGSQWNSANSPTTYALYDIKMTSATAGWLVGQSGTAARWDGNNWSNTNTNSPSYDLYSISTIPGSSNAYAVGESGIILYWNGTTNTWSTASSPTSSHLYGLSLVTASDGWAVGETGTILRWNGSSWTNFSSPTSINLHDVMVTSASEGWATGDNGTVLRWNGTTWSVYTPNLLSNNLFGISMLPSGSGGIIVGENGANLSWNGSSWNVIAKPLTGYIELMIPNTAIGMQDTTGSYAVSLFSLASTGGGMPLDSVPNDPDISTTGQLRFFASTSERIPLSFPPNTVNGDDPSAYASILPIFWEYPVGAPWAGATMKTYLDPQFTTEATNGSFDLVSNTPFYASTSHAWPLDFQGDNSYYWRIRPRYLDATGPVLGAWTQGWSMRRKGFIPTNLNESVTFATPTFSWDMTEGAESYQLQVDDDPNFGSTVFDLVTAAATYTPQSTLSNGTYYWRVRARRNGNIINDWTASRTFTLSLPLPTNLHHIPAGVVDHAPTMCWDPLIQAAPAGGDPVLAAYRYRIQISKDPTFSTIYDYIDTEQVCWTPVRGYDDGTYYWRVAMADGDNKMGSYSDTATFTKQYPITTLVSPVNGSNSATTPTFVWTAVTRAANYRLQVARDSYFTNMVESLNTPNTRYTPVVSYTSGTIYYWRVAIIDANGVVGPYNTATIIIGSGIKIYLPAVLRNHSR